MTQTPAPDWHARAAALRIDGRMVIDGQRHPTTDGAAFDCRSPLDNRLLCAVARGRQADVDRAAASARLAFEQGRWSRQPPAQRKKTLLRWVELILARRDEHPPGAPGGAPCASARCM